MRRFAVFTAALAGAVIGLYAQSPPAAPQQPPTFRTGIDVVQVDVSVLDRNRRPVKGLSAADFTVLENGKRQPIVAFAPVDIPDAVDPPAPWMRDVAPDVSTNDLSIRRVVVLVLDDAYMPFDPAVSAFAKRIGHNVVDRLGPNDLAAVAFTMYGKRQEITNDRQRLLAAIDSLIPHPTMQAAPSRFSAAAGPPMPTGRTGPGPCAYRGTYGCVIDTLTHAADALANAPPGRKTLIYISTGVPYDFSMENLEAANDIRGVQEMFRTLQQANVNIYAFDPSGLTAEGIIGARLDAMRMFAENTGGRAVIATNTPWDHVAQVFQENSSYYLLGFRSTNAKADGSFRRIEVKVDRPDVETRTRSGYYAPAAPKPSRKPAPVVSALDKALGSGLPTGDVPLAIQAGAIAVPGQRQAAVAIAIGLQPPVNAAQPAQTIKVVAAAFDTDWKQRGGNEQTVQLTLGRDPNASRQIETLARMTLAPGRYQVRVAADNGESSGSVFADVDVPNFWKDRLSASGLFLTAAPRPPGVLDRLFSDLLPIVPTTVREFRPGTRVSVFVRLYQAGSEPEAVRVTRTLRDEANHATLDETTFVDAARFKSSGSADYQWEVPMSTLASGAHLLTIQASVGRLSIRRDVRFAIK